MKRIRGTVLLLVIFILACNVCLASIIPTYTTTVPRNVYGFLQVDKPFVVYEHPNNTSKVIETVKWDSAEVLLKNDAKMDLAQLFAVLVPSKNFAFCYVMDEEDGWFQILYNKEQNKLGWVKPDKPDNFWSLKDFYTYFGKEYSLYYLRDTNKKLRTLKSAPSDEAQSLQGFNVTKNIKLILIKGNWALVSIVDLESSVPKTGYVKWRDSDGVLYLFPKMD